MNSKSNSQIMLILLIERRQDFYFRLHSTFRIPVVNLFFFKRFQMGGFRSQPELTKHTLSKEGPGFTYALSHMCGWREFMEDATIAAVLSDKKSFLFGVFDGHGGAEVSTFVQRHFVKEFESNKNFKKKSYELALKETFLRMDELLLSNQGKTEILAIQKQMKDAKNGPEYDEPSHAGCTANVCLITPDTIYVANAGDSRAVYCNLKGETKQLSKDHKPELKTEADRIKKAGGEIYMGRVNGNLNLTRAIGDLEYKTNKKLPPQEQIITANPEIIKIKNQGIDILVMGCDGIWEVKSNSDITGFIKARISEKKTLGKAAQMLMDELIAKDSKTGEHGMDNMSVIVVKFGKNRS